MNTKKTILRPDELASRWGISKTTLWRWRKEKLIPQPLLLGPRMIGWHVDVIAAVEQGIENTGGL